MGGCCGKSSSVFDSSAHEKIDKLLAKLEKVEASNAQMLAESKAAADELRSLLSSPWAEQLRKERVLLEQVLHRRWPLQADQLHLEPVVYKSTSATRGEGIPSQIEVNLPYAERPPEPVPLGYTKQHSSYY